MAFGMPHKIWMNRVRAMFWSCIFFNADYSTYNNKIFLTQTLRRLTNEVSAQKAQEKRSAVDSGYGDVMKFPCITLR